MLDIGTSRDAETHYLRKTAAFSGQVGDEGDSLKILLHGAPHRPCRARSARVGALGPLNLKRPHISDRVVVAVTLARRRLPL